VGLDFDGACAMVYIIGSIIIGSIIIEPRRSF
jgi:hypothetical protein